MDEVKVTLEQFLGNLSLKVHPYLGDGLQGESEDSGEESVCTRRGFCSPHSPQPTHYGYHFCWCL